MKIGPKQTLVNAIVQAAKPDVLDLKWLAKRRESNGSLPVVTGNSARRFVWTVFPMAALKQLLDPLECVGAGADRLMERLA